MIRSIALLCLPIRRVFRRWIGLPCRRALARPEPVYFSRLRHLGDDEWRAALAESPQKAAQWVHAAALNGSPEAHLVYGQMLLDGHGLPSDPHAALRWFRIAANAGSIDGINMVGRCHERGWGVAADPAEAARWFRRAADAGHGWAGFNLGMLLLEGAGVARDPRAALELFVRSARGGNAKSMAMIGQYREHGWAACRRDRASAMRWYRRAADRGCFRGAFHTGRFLLLQGRAVDALPWLEASVLAAPVEACRALAGALLEWPEPAVQALGRRALARTAGADGGAG